MRPSKLVKLFTDSRGLKQNKKRFLDSILSKVGGIGVDDSDSPPPVPPRYVATDEDYQDLLNFLHYLNHNRRSNQAKSAGALSNASLPDSLVLNQTRTSNESSSATTVAQIDDLNHHELPPVPAALIQLLIIVLVVLSILFLCKCNKLMAFCRHEKSPAPSEAAAAAAAAGMVAEELDDDDERYHDRMTCKDYLCFLWYRCRIRHRLANRRNKRFIRKNYANSYLHTQSRGGHNASQKLARAGGVHRKRKASIIFNRRRSAIFQPPSNFPPPTGSYRTNQRRRTTKHKFSMVSGGSAAIVNESNESVFQRDDQDERLISGGEIIIDQNRIRKSISSGGSNSSSHVKFTNNATSTTSYNNNNNYNNNVNINKNTNSNEPVALEGFELKQALI